MSAVLLATCLIVIGCVVGLLVARTSAGRRRRVEEPLTDVADRVLAQLRALPETRERKTPGL